MSSDSETAFDFVEREQLSRLAAEHLRALFDDYREMQRNVGTERPKMCFALFVYPEQASNAAMVTNSTREFALDMCKQWISNAEST